MAQSSQSGKPRVALLVPPAMQARVFTAEQLERLRSLAEVVGGDGDTATLAAQLPSLLPEVDACLTGWNAPRLTPDLLTQASRLRIVAHSAGTIKGIVPIEAFERGIAVCHAASIIAEAVCEATLLLMLTGLRRFHLLDVALKAGKSWADANAVYPGHQLMGSNVGLIGSGYVARQVIALLKPFRLSLRVYDPYLSPERAAELGVVPASLDDVFAASQIVSNHAPITPETKHLIAARQLALLRDGALFINTARSWTVDYDALLRESERGRFWTALDVFEEEPLPPDSPFRRLDNVFLTPHVAGRTVETWQKQGSAMIDELERFFAGQPLQHQVTKEAYAIMA